MIDKVFIDTNILVYLFDKSEKEKQTRVKKLISELLPQTRMFVSVQVINEFINVTGKKIATPISPAQQKEIIEFINDIFIITSLNVGTTLSALEISQKYKISFWDSLIISSALENKCNVLYSEDMQNEFSIYNKIKIVNPFIKVQ
ncbi:MAG: PIN domain-containing protein [Ignavibacteriaceae bacterium]